MTNEIQWKDGAVCYAHGEKWFAHDNHLLINDGNVVLTPEECKYFGDFQLNQILIRDYMPISELSTEQKYNDVVDVFGLFGFGWGVPEHAPELESFRKTQAIFINESGHLMYGSTRHGKRQLTYTQVMAIGKLKRMMDECKSKPEDGLARAAKDIKEGRIANASSNKYERVIYDRYGDSSHVDVYDVLQAFEVTCPATQHAIKKLLCSGLRGHKDAETDLLEAKESINRAIELHENK